jgi:hypothetical protein
MTPSQRDAHDFLFLHYSAAKHKTGKHQTQGITCLTHCDPERDDKVIQDLTDDLGEAAKKCGKILQRHRDRGTSPF